MNENFYRHLAEIITNRQSAWTATVMNTFGSSPSSEGMKMLIPENDNETYGTIGGGDIEFQVIKIVRETKPYTSTTITFEFNQGNSMICGGKATVFIEPLNQYLQLYIFGAGHCGVALSNLASHCGFKVTVVDSRKDWAIQEKHPQATECRIIDYSQADTIITHPEKSFAVIMTYGHQFDELVLEKIVNLPLKYIGMMGSKSKVEEVFSNLQAKGISMDLLKSVYAPIGIDIHSRTPWEIAVSIVAELIKVSKE
ncbi:MAG: XdhC family protein [Candidatus Cloacimonetes bacterium]|nr:XdhC family protein [Candidatus Cloacimonadota bacterium]